MKRKCTLILTFLIMAIFLSGCTGGVVTPVTAGYYSDSESVSVYYYLQKVGNSWKIYGP